jgi:hypothetical protein
MLLTSPWRWRQHGPLKRWYTTPILHLVTTQKMDAAWTSETLVSYHNPEDGGSMDLWNVGILPQLYTASQPRRWRQHGPPKRWYPTTTLHGVTTQKMDAAWTSETLVSYHNPEDGGSMDLWNGGILPQHYTASQPRKWGQHGPLKRWYPTTTIHDVTAWRWRQHGPLKLWYPTKTLSGVTTQKTSIWYTTALRKPQNYFHFCLYSVSQ